MIIDPLCRQLERSVSDSAVQRQAERREEGQVEMFCIIPGESFNPSSLRTPHLSARGEQKLTVPLLLAIDVVLTHTIYASFNIPKM